MSVDGARSQAPGRVVRVLTHAERDSDVEQKRPAHPLSGQPCLLVTQIRRLFIERRPAAVGDGVGEEEGEKQDLKKKDE